MKKILLFLTLVGFAAGSPLRRAGAAEALDWVPTQAAAVVRLASVDKFVGGFQELVTTLGPPSSMAGPEFAKGINEIMQVAADGSAIDRAAPVYLALFPIGGQPEIAWLVRAADDAKLRRAVLKVGESELPAAEASENGFEKLAKDGKDWYFSRRGDWSVYTQHLEVVKQMTAQPEPAFATLVEERASTLMHEGDAALFVNITRLVEVYGDKLDALRDDLRRKIDNLPKELLGGDNGLNPEATKKMYADAAELGINAMYDARWAAGRLTFSAGGVNVAALLAVTDQTNTSDLLAANPPASLENLGLLPSGASAYFGYTAYSQALADWSRDWVKLAYGADSPNTEKILAGLDAITQGGASSTVGSFSLPSGLDNSLRTTKITQATDPDKLRAGVAGYEPAANQLNTPLFSQSADVMPGAETYQDHSIDLLTLHFDFKEVADAGQQIGQKFVEKIFGGKQMQTRITTVENFVVQASGNDPKYLHELINGLQSGEKVLGLDDAFSQARDELGEQANFVVLLNAPRLLIDILALVRHIPPLDMVLAQAPINFGAQPAESFTGFSLSTEPQALRVNLFIPTSQPQGILRIFNQGG
jgi:hypothetical protein